MGDWKVIESGETTGNFAAEGGAAGGRVTTYAKYGVYSYRVQTAANNDGIRLTLSALANAVHYVTVRVRGTLPAGWDWSLDNAAYTVPSVIKALDADWTVYGLQFPAAQANGSTTLRIHQNGAGAGDFYIDGVQVEEKEYWTTYCDGTQKGCEWDGAEHASASRRSGQSRAGGRVRNLSDDYGFRVADALGAGAAPQALGVDEYALLPGGELNSVKVQARTFTLVGPLLGTNLHAARQALISILSPGAYPKGADGWQPVRLRYTGADVEKEIAAHYAGGLEGAIKLDNLVHEKVALRFLAEDPFWYEIGESAEVLDSENTATLRYIAGRLRSTGQWDDLGLTANPWTSGTVWDIVLGPDGRIYVGGQWTSLDGVAGRDNIAAYDPATDTWTTVGGASDINAVVYTLAFGPDGTLYAGGMFTNAGGDANADYLAQFSAGAWSAVGQPVQGAAAITSVRDIAVDRVGDLVIVGDFLNWADITDADYIVKWDASAAAYVAIGTPNANSVAYAVVVDSLNGYYIGGNFSNIDGIPAADGVAYYDPVTGWAAVGSGSIIGVRTLAITQDDILYIGGIFQNWAGIAEADCIVKFDGTAYTALGTGILYGPDTVWNIKIAPDGMVYVVGTFTEAGGITLTDRAAKWNGSSWAHLDVDLPGAPIVYGLAVVRPDPVIKQNYDVYLGFTWTGAGVFAGDVTPTNAGTELAYPKIVISRSGGTSAILEEIRNETIGKELLFDYSLLDGETLTIDLTPTQKSIISSFFGPRPDAILANSDFGSFVLQPGDNLVTCFVAEAGGPTVAAYMLWRDTYNGYD